MFPKVYHKFSNKINIWECRLERLTLGRINWMACSVLKRYFVEEYVKGRVLDE